MTELESRIIAALKKIHDPEIPVNIHDLGLIYGIEVDDDAAVRIRMTLTAPNCPVADQLVQQARDAAAGVEGVSSVEIQLVWEPAWSSECMSEDARLALDMMGISWKDPKPPGDGFTSMTFGKTPRR